MSKTKDKQSVIKKPRGPWDFGAFHKFIEQHLIGEHDVHMLVDPAGKSYHLVCTTCDMQFGH
jgi:hypothetical protein